MKLDTMITIVFVLGLLIALGGVALAVLHGTGNGGTESSIYGPMCAVGTIVAGLGVFANVMRELDL